ncbi:MAG TPA: TerC family protein [Tepidisphaeraceae bacterium]|nr:TerC family protein [Tepidisphaeraceae bacterium]
MLIELLAVAEATTQHAGAGLTSFFSVEAIIAFLTLCALEIVLGVDNVIFISILSNRLPEHQAKKARQLGLMLAMGIRILLLLLIGWIMSLTKTLISFDQFWTAMRGDEFGITGRDIILLVGGLFLMYKSVHEIHNKLEGEDHLADGTKKTASFMGTIAQILLLDIVFSLDSVITAVGMVQTDPNHKHIGLTIMIAAIVLSVIVMLVSAGGISSFVERHPTVKMLALAFLLMIGMVLIADGMHVHVPKGYVYFAMAFALGVEVLNLQLRKRGKPVHLHGPAV